MNLEIKNIGTVDAEVVSGEAVVATIAPGQSITIMPVEEDPPPPPSGKLAAALAAWNAANASSKVLLSGTDAWTNPSPSSGNKDYIDPNPSHAIRQHGTISRIEFDVGGSVQVAGWKVKVWRLSGTTYSLVGQSEAFTPAAFGIQTRDLTSPITGVQPGDFVGIYVPGGAVINTEYPALTLNIIYVGGDNSVLNNPALPVDWFPRLKAYGPAPFAVVIGDSIEAGHGETFYRPFLDAGISGDPAGEPASHIRTNFPDFTYQNFSRGSQTWAWAVSNAAAIAALSPRAVICGFGVNDIALGRTAEQVVADMASFKAAMPSGTKMFVCEVLPWTSGTDAQAAATRSLNAVMSAWCAANGAVLVECHDAMGQTRATTGQIDDLKTAYDHDGIHLKAAGVVALSSLIEQALDSYVW